MKPLTERELQIARLLSSGLSNKAIATLLDCSIKTVEKHRQAIYYKWHIDNLLSLVRVGLRSGELDIEEFLSSPIGENVAHAGPQSFERIRISK